MCGTKQLQFLLHVRLSLAACLGKYINSINALSGTLTGMHVRRLGVTGLPILINPCRAWHHLHLTERATVLHGWVTLPNCLPHLPEAEDPDSNNSNPLLC